MREDLASGIPSGRFRQGRTGPLLATFLSALALFLSLAALNLTSRAGRQDEKLAHCDFPHWAQALQLLAVYEERWNSEEMVQIRAEAATSLLARSHGDEVETVLAFFDELGMLVARRALDPELLWYRFYWPAASYLLAANRLDDAKERAVTYPYLAALLTRLQEVHKARTPKDQVLRPMDEEIDGFLADEASPPSCEEPDSEEDQDEVQMTPL